MVVCSSGGVVVDIVWACLLGIAVCVCGDVL